MENIFKSKSECPPCDPCRTVFNKQSERGVGFCVTCVEYLCISCVNHHRKLKATRNHTLLSGDELPGSKAPFEMLDVIDKCTDHPEEEIAYECDDHEQFLCLNCAKTKHLKCSNLKEIALHVSVESDRTKLLGDCAKIKINEEKVEALKFEKIQNIGIIINQRDEIFEKQQILKTKLEKALRDIEIQQEQVQSSFERKLNMTNLDIKRLDKIKERIALNGQFVQVTSKYASPAQLYIVASGHFEDVDNLLEDFQTDNKPSKSDVKISDINDDILNLLLTVDISKHILDSSSDSEENASDAIVEHATASKVCQTQHSSNTVNVNKVNGNTPTSNNPYKTAISTESIADNGNLNNFLDAKAASPEACGYVMNDMPMTTGTTPSQNRKSLMQSKAELALTLIVNCPGDTKPCDIVGVTTLNGNEFIYVVDYANTKLKVFDNHLKFFLQKSLHLRPCGICSSNNKEIAILFTEKSIVIYDVSSFEIKPLRSISLTTYGHSITKYGDNIAVMCSDERFDGNQDNIKHAVTLDIYDYKLGTRIYQIPYKLRHAIRNPCQIYSRFDTEIILSTENDITNYRSDGKMRWFYYRDELLRKSAGVTSDTNGNLYVCGYKSNNIHQISHFGYAYSKVLVSEIQRPWSIAFDRRGELMIVACRKQDRLYVYKFIQLNV